MTPERWRRVNEIFEHVRSLPPGRDADAYLQEACSADASMHSEIVQLLKEAECTDPYWDYASLTGKSLSHYCLLDRLSAGTASYVYKARDLRLGRAVVIKLLSPILREDSAIAARFAKESVCLSQLNHTNIVTIHEVDEDHGLAFLVMEYVEGKTLRERLNEGPVPLTTALEYARQIGEALAAAHSKGITHRDLKPSNILLTPEGMVKVIDFGLAKHSPQRTTDSERTPPGSVIGTVGYMAPEQVRGSPTDERSDIFSLGVILYELATGRRAFQRTTPADTMAAILRDPALQPDNDLPDPVWSLIQKCLAKDPDDRFQSAREFLNALQAARRGDVRLLQTRSAHPLSRVLLQVGAVITAILVIGVATQKDRFWSKEIVPTKTFAADAAPASEPAKQFYAGQEFFSQAVSQDCKKRSPVCPKEKLKSAISSYASALQARPRHSGSLWNQGLAYVALCELESRDHQYSEALKACDSGIDDFSVLLTRPATYQDMSRNRPDEADVLYNRGIAHRLKAGVETLHVADKRNEFTLSIADFDTILNNEGRYSAYLKNQLGKVVRARDEALKDKIALH